MLIKNFILFAFIVPCFARYKMPMPSPTTEAETTEAITTTTKKPTTTTEAVPSKPCPNTTCDLHDLQCIGNELAANSKCNKYHVWDSLPENFMMTNVVSEVPAFNATYIDQYVTISHIGNCKVSAFFTDMEKDTNVLSTVLAIECRGLHLEAKRLLVKHRSQQLDDCYKFSCKKDYPLIRITINLTPPDNLCLCTTRAYTEIAVSPTFTLEPADEKTKLYMNNDPDGLVAMLDVVDREQNLIRGNIIFEYFVNMLICDFGCSPTTTDEYKC